MQEQKISIKLLHVLTATHTYNSFSNHHNSQPLGFLKKKLSIFQSVLSDNCPLFRDVTIDVQLPTTSEFDLIDIYRHICINVSFLLFDLTLFFDHILSKSLIITIN